MTEWIITSSVLIVIITVLRFLLRGKISLKLQYALWGLVLVRLLLPFSVVESSASVLNLMQEKEEAFTLPVYYEPYVPSAANPPAFDEDIFILDDNTESIEPENNIAVDDNGFVTGPEIRVISAKDILIPLWIGGMAVFGTLFAVSNLRFSRKLKKTRQYVSDRKARLSVYVTPAVRTPCLFGTVKPAIYVTEEVLADGKVFSHVLEHETTHYRHGDHVWSVLRCLCLAVHWYNPLVWLAAFLSMRDSELACDEDTIKRIGESERIEYGRTLINLTCEKPSAGILSAATTMTGSKSSIKERIMLIAKKPKMLKITAALVAIIAFSAIGCTFTGAVKYNPKTTDEPAVETFSNKIEFDLSEIKGKIRMTVTDASPEDITTEIFNETSEEIYYRISYSLYFEQDGKWYVLPKINDNNEFDFGTKIVESGKTGLWTSDVKEIYGKLPDGKYCIIRTINYGESDFVENEFYVIGAEFILEDGKLSYEKPVSVAKGNYEIKEQIFLNFASSYLEIPERRYEITENSFAVYDSESGDEIEHIAVSEWKWEEFPYSEESWNKLFVIGLDYPDIFKYQNKYYQPINSEKSILYLDGELWLMELSPAKPASEEYWVWSICELAPVEETEKSEENKALWEFAPAMSSKEPWFRFEFDFDFSLINVGVYAGEGEGTLYDVKSSENVNALGLENGEAVLWIPTNDGIGSVPSATVNFVVYQDGDLEKYTHTGSLKIKQISSENGKTIYEATLVSETLFLAQNDESGGGIISVKPEEIPFPETEAMTDEEFIAAAKEMGYSDEQLDAIFALMEEGLTKSHVLHPHAMSASVPGAEKTADGKYYLGTFFFDPDIYADYSGPIGFAYIRENGVMKIIPEVPDIFSDYGIIDNKHYVFGGGGEVRFYEFENPSEPYAIWKVPEQENTEFGYWGLDLAVQKNVEKAFVCYIDIPNDFDKVYSNRTPDLSSTYQIAVLDSEGNLLRNIDTGINLMIEFSGLPDCIRPEIVTASENSVLFKINNLHYTVDYSTEGNVAEQYIFTENDVVKYSNIDFTDAFAQSAVTAVEDYITENYSGNKDVLSFNIRRAEIDENATYRAINLSGGSVKELFDTDDVLNGFLVIRTITDINYADGTTDSKEFKYFLLFDPENKYDRGPIIVNSGWKFIDGSKEMFDAPAFDDSRFYIYFEEGKTG